MIGLSPSELLSIQNELSSLENQFITHINQAYNTILDIRGEIHNQGLIQPFVLLSNDVETSGNSIAREIYNLQIFLNKQVTDYEASADEASSKITEALNLMEKIVSS